MSFDIFPQSEGVLDTFVSKGLIAPSAGDNRESFQDIVEKESQPDAFSLTMLSDQIHAIIPVAAADEGQPVLAEAQAIANGPDTMLVKGGSFVGNNGSIIVGLFICPQWTTLEERYSFIQHPCVT